MKKLIIVPAFNESESILEVIKDIKENAPGYDYVVINDASTDTTKKICEENNIHFLDLASNMGIGGAVQTGYKYALYENYDIAVQLDGDGQHMAASIPKMEQKMIDENANMVIGSRYIDNQGFQSTRLRRFAIKYFSWLIRICTGQKITDPTSGLRMCDKSVIKFFAKLYPWDYPEPESTTTILKMGCNVKEVPVVMKERQGGKSSLSNPAKAVFYMIKVSAGIIIESAGRRKV